MPENEGGPPRTADLFLESTLASVERAETLVLNEARTLGFNEDDQYRIGIAVRETMVNAVAHGNRYNARKRVHLVVRTYPDRLEIEIADEGKGFTVEQVPDPLSQENLLGQSGRGLLMIQAFMDGFDMKRQEPQGTVVTLMKRLSSAPE